MEQPRTKPNNSVIGNLLDDSGMSGIYSTKEIEPFSNYEEILPENTVQPLSNNQLINASGKLVDSPSNIINLNINDETDNTMNIQPEMNMNQEMNMQPEMNMNQEMNIQPEMNMNQEMNMQPNTNLSDNIMPEYIMPEYELYNTNNFNTPSEIQTNDAHPAFQTLTDNVQTDTGSFTSKYQFLDSQSNQIPHCDYNNQQKTFTNQHGTQGLDHPEGTNPRMDLREQSSSF